MEVITVLQIFAPTQGAFGSNEYSIVFNSEKICFDVDDSAFLETPVK